MTFDKEAQRARAEQYAKDQIAKGVKVPVLPPLAINKPKAKVYKNPNFVAEPFMNNLGQVVKPGDSVVVIATGYSHSIKTYRGVFLGVIKNPNGKISSVSVGGIKAKVYKSGRGYVDCEVRRSYPSKRVYALK